MKPKKVRGIDIIEHMEQYLILPHGVRRNDKGEFEYYFGKFGPNGEDTWVNWNIQEIGE